MKSIPMRTVKSSQIYSIGHAPLTNTLAVRFKNKDGLPTSLYTYSNVTEEQFAEFVGADSVGAHFGKHFKAANDNHPFTRMPDFDPADIERRARAAHEANRAYCASIGDDSQVAWEDAPQWQRDSAIVGVKHALAGATPEELHASWTAQKVADGWVHGDVKDADAKTHPCLVAYADLPEAQRKKDQIFRDAVFAA